MGGACSDTPLTRDVLLSLWRFLSEVTGTFVNVNIQLWFPGGRRTEFVHQNQTEPSALCHPEQGHELLQRCTRDDVIVTMSLSLASYAVQGRSAWEPAPSVAGCIRFESNVRERSEMGRETVGRRDHH